MTAQSGQGWHHNPNLYFFMFLGERDFQSLTLEVDVRLSILTPPKLQMLLESMSCHLKEQLKVNICTDKNIKYFNKEIHHDSVQLLLILWVGMESHRFKKILLVQYLDSSLALRSQMQVLSVVMAVAQNWGRWCSLFQCSWQ